MKEKEIELKFIINQDIKNKILEELIKKNAKKIGEEHIIDTYYIPSFKSFEKDGETMECVRIREEQGKITLGYKKIHRECDPVYCDEYETIIDSKEQTEKIFFALGFSVQMVIDKVRTSFEYNSLQFDFDSVKNFGELLEVELLDNNDEVNKIYEFVKPFGLTKKDVTYKGIQKLLKEK